LLGEECTYQVDRALSITFFFSSAAKSAFFN